MLSLSGKLTHFMEPGGLCHVHRSPYLLHSEAIESIQEPCTLCLLRLILVLSSCVCLGLQVVPSLFSVIAFSLQVCLQIWHYPTVGCNSFWQSWYNKIADEMWGPSSIGSLKKCWRRTLQVMRHFAFTQSFQLVCSGACVVISGNQKQGSIFIIFCDFYRINGCSVTLYCQVKELEGSLKFQKKGIAIIYL